MVLFYINNLAEFISIKILTQNINLTTNNIQTVYFDFDIEKDCALLIALDYSNNVDLIASPVYCPTGAKNSTKVIMNYFTHTNRNIDVKIMIVMYKINIH